MTTTTTATTTKPKKRKVRATICTPVTQQMPLMMPREPSDAVAEFMTTLSWGFSVGLSVGERIADGRKQYARLRDFMVRERITANQKRGSIRVNS